MSWTVKLNTPFSLALALALASCQIQQTQVIHCKAEVTTETAKAECHQGEHLDAEPIGKERGGPDRELQQPGEPFSEGIPGNSNLTQKLET